MKSFKNFLLSENEIKPTSPAQKIPKKLPPKQPPLKKPAKKQSSPPPSRELPRDTAEKSPNLGFRPYGREKS